MLSLILLALFVGISATCYVGLKGATETVDQYAQSVSLATESNMKKLYLFTDARKLILVYLLVLIGVPLLLFIVGAGFLTICAAVLALIVAPRIFFTLMKQRRRQLIHAVLPDALAQIAGSMRAGASFALAIQSFVEEDKGPLGQELTLLLREQRLGASLDDALDNLAERLQSEEIDLVVAAAIIANEVGGNLAEILQGLSVMLRRKMAMEGKIAALTAQGKLQGYVVSALPFGILAILAHFEPEATLPIFNGLLGWLFLVLLLLMVVMGTVMIQKIVSIDI